MANNTSSPGRYPAFSIALRTTSTASSLLPKLGAKPPSSPTLVLWPWAFNTLLRLWKISVPMRKPSVNVSAPTGMTMNSWMSILLSACEPPFKMFIMGTGRVRAPTPPT